MSGKAAESEAAPADPPPRSKKLLIIIVAAVLLLALVGGGAAMFLMKKKANSEDHGDGQHEEVVEKAKPAKKSAPDPKNPPVYLPMEAMVVNLADPGGSRFAQLSITLKLDEAKTAELVKMYMPSIRSAVLLQVARKTADELLAPEGKEKLSIAIMKEVGRQLGYEVEDEEEDPPEEGVKPKKKKKKAPVVLPVEAVLYSSFIIQ